MHIDVNEKIADVPILQVRKLLRSGRDFEWTAEHAWICCG
jgi:hypothetical protein